MFPFDGILNTGCITFYETSLMPITLRAFHQHRLLTYLKQGSERYKPTFRMLVYIFGANSNAGINRARYVNGVLWDMLIFLKKERKKTCIRMGLFPLCIHDKQHFQMPKKCLHEFCGNFTKNLPPNAQGLRGGN